MAVSTSSFRIVAYCGTLANNVTTMLHDSTLTASGDQNFTFDLSGKGYTVASMQINIYAFEFSANDEMPITPALLTWSC